MTFITEAVRIESDFFDHFTQHLRSRHEEMFDEGDVIISQGAMLLDRLVFEEIGETYKHCLYYEDFKEDYEALCGVGLDKADFVLAYRK